jgi:type 1 glutamine amidotransferase
MLVLSLTDGHRHTDSIVAGQRMLQEMATEQSFEPKFTETMEEFTVEGLSQYEIVFFLNTSGNFFSEAQKQDFQEWMTQHNGAYAGIHSATDTENGWNFYSEVTGQYYSGHTVSPDTPGEVQWDAAQIGHVAVQGMPSPWTRQEEWYKFNQNAQWSTKPGFVILGRVALNDDGGNRPVSFTREWSNFRSFYTSMGHAGTTVSDPNFKKHVTGGVMWAVRREAAIK